MALPHLPLGFPWRAPGWPGGIPRALPPSHTGVAYDTSWARTDAVRIARSMVLEGLGRPFVSVVASPEIRGLDRIEDVSHPVIFAANHASHIDTLIVLSCLPERFRHRTVVAAGADYFFDRPWKATLSAGLLGGIPVERNKVNRASSDLAGELLGESWSLVIFPEGGRTPDGWGQSFRGGAAYLSSRWSVPVVPIHLAGTRGILPKGGSKISRRPTTITFGTPLQPQPSEDTRRFGARIEAAVAGLADEQASDWWSARKRAALGETPSLTGPVQSGWRRTWSATPLKTIATQAPRWPKTDK